VQELESGVSSSAVPFSEIPPHSSAEPALSGEGQPVAELSAELERLDQRARALNASPQALSLARAVLLALSEARGPAA
jgi:hypothetical protein